MNKETAKAILIANLKGARAKRSKLTEIARAVRLLKHDEYSSTKALAKAFGVSRSIIEAFDRILDQPPEIRKLIESGEVLLDTSTKLVSITDRRRRIEIAKQVAGETAFDARYIIDYAKKHPEITAKECKRIVFASKDSVTSVHVVVVPLDDQLFRRFQDQASSRKLRLEDAAKLAIEEWLVRGAGTK